MSTLYINGKECEFTDEPNILEVIRKAGFDVPTFCYRPDLKPFGSCRMCVVEVEYPNGRVMVNSSCTMPPEAGIKVSTNTARVRKIRKTGIAPRKPRQRMYDLRQIRQLRFAKIRRRIRYQTNQIS